MLSDFIGKKNVFFVKLLGVLILLFGSIAFLSLYLVKSSNIVLYKLVLYIILILAIITSLFIVINAIFIVHLLKGKKISSFSRKWVQVSLKFIYVNVINIARLFKLDKEKIRGTFSELNNRLVLFSDVHVKSEEILILLPHCIQKSSCPYKITTDINNCKRCGLCDIDELIRIKDQYNVRIHVATGGTLARKIIKEIMPKVIIAVACERDLSSGIMDVKKIPIIGVLNERPEGPCVNTKVDVKRIEDAILNFTNTRSN